MFTKEEINSLSKFLIALKKEKGVEKFDIEQLKQESLCVIHQNVRVFLFSFNNKYRCSILSNNKLIHFNEKDFLDSMARFRLEFLRHTSNGKF